MKSVNEKDFIIKMKKIKKINTKCKNNTSLV